MRRCLIIILCLGFTLAASADHITGGQMFYVYQGNVNGYNNYRVTLMLYMRCNSGRQFPNPGYVSVFEKNSNIRLQDIAITLSGEQTIRLAANNPCITNPPDVCYIIGTYIFNVSLLPNVNGYILSSQVNFRIAGINNLSQGYGQIGATYTAEIPGTLSAETAAINTSARFTGSDLVVVCANSPFNYSFAATDEDGDELRYSFCEAYVAGGGGRGAEAEPPSQPPYQSVPYASAFGASLPLGKQVSIDGKTGLITGIAPGEGIYVVTVCVEELRNGKVIAVQRKDLQINITNCKIAAAALLPDYQLCGDTKILTISNLSSSPLITSYNWELFTNEGLSVYSATSSTASYTFTDTGMYKMKLVVNRNGICSDSATTNVKVYPGFKPAFDFTGICINKPTYFTDRSASVYGVVNSWIWDFGDNFSNDFSDEQNTSYTYKTTGVKNVSLTVTATKGCEATLVEQVGIVEKPPIQLAFKDTLICVSDKLQLNASGSGMFSWMPTPDMQYSNTASPVVSPAITTTYYVHLDDGGCINDDSVRVNVVDHVSLQAMPDTVICSGDEIQLRVQSNALHYSWSPASSLNDAVLANPLAVTDTTMEYEVTGIIGSCAATDRVVVTTVPYPTAYAGEDVQICHNTRVQLQGTTDGHIYQWLPTGTLNNSSIINPVAFPVVIGTTPYIFHAYDTKGCPKPGVDTVIVTMLPDINAFAGNDTTVVIGQPLQLQAQGGVRYEWSPAVNLSNPGIANPVAVYASPSAGITYKVSVYNEADCMDEAYITVKIFATQPTVFVPSAFTPNGDGINDRLRPIAAGMRSIEYFNVYNRWGQLVFSGRDDGLGWDGTIGGKMQSSGTFVWVVKGTDYNGKSYLQKGTTTIIR